MNASWSEKSKKRCGMWLSQPDVSMPMKWNPKDCADCASTAESPTYVSDAKLETWAASKARVSAMLMISILLGASWADANATSPSSTPAVASFSRAVGSNPRSQPQAPYPAMNGRDVAC
jgi:hypothetical protein